MQDDFRGLKEDARALETQLDQSRGREAQALSEARQAREEADAQRQTVRPSPLPPQCNNPCMMMCKHAGDLHCCTV